MYVDAQLHVYSVYSFGIEKGDVREMCCCVDPRVHRCAFPQLAKCPGGSKQFFLMFQLVDIRHAALFIICIIACARGYSDREACALRSRLLKVT